MGRVAWAIVCVIVVLLAFGLVVYVGEVLGP